MAIVIYFKLKVYSICRRRPFERSNSIGITICSRDQRTSHSTENQAVLLLRYKTALFFCFVPQEKKSHSQAGSATPIPDFLIVEASFEQATVSGGEIRQSRW